MERLFRTMFIMLVLKKYFKSYVSRKSVNLDPELWLDGNFENYTKSSFDCSLLSQQIMWSIFSFWCRFLHDALHDTTLQFLSMLGTGWLSKSIFTHFFFNTHIFAVNVSLAINDACYSSIPHSFFHSHTLSLCLSLSSLWIHFIACILVPPWHHRFVYLPQLWLMFSISFSLWLFFSLPFRVCFVILHSATLSHSLQYMDPFLFP